MRARFSIAIMALASILSACASAPSSTVVASGGASSVAVGYLAEIRNSGGLSRATPDSRLEKAAEQQARYMAEAARMTHTTRPGRDFSTRMRANGIGGKAAENIAHGRMDLPKLFNTWKNSPPHNRNMMDPAYGRFGLASATDTSGRRYWALVMGQ